MFTDVTAIVVTFNPEHSFYDCLNSYVDLFNKVVIVDNGSASTFRNELLSIEKKFKNVYVIYLEKNEGIAKAQNMGIFYAYMEVNHSWVCLLDHDSKIEQSVTPVVNRTLKFLDNHHPQIAMFGLHPMDEKSGRPDLLTDAIVGVEINGMTKVQVLMASGSFIKLSAIEHIGLMNETYFIDDVDHEFSLRAYHFGYEVYVLDEAFLVHNVGNTLKHSLFGRQYTTTGHSSFRKYYMIRNAIWTAKKYRKIFPDYIYHDLKIHFVDMAKVLLFEKKHRFSSIKSYLAGLYDGCFRSAGKYPKLQEYNQVK